MWPSSLNPCHAGHEKKSAYYDVQGKVTKLCVFCADERRGRLDSFIPDLRGADVKPKRILFA